jgi:hypothetical protein
MSLTKLELWCQDAITILAGPDDIPSLIELRRETVRGFAHSPHLYEVAADIAEDLNDLVPDSQRVVREYLIANYGFSFEFFVDKKLAEVRKVLARGRIGGEKDVRLLSDFAADTSNDEVLTAAADSLLEDYARLMKR